MIWIAWGVMYALDFSFDKKVLSYAIPMGAVYAVVTWANISALKCGPVSLTALFLQLSLIATTVWGFFFWGEKVTVLSVVGLVLAICSLVLCLYEKKSSEKEGGKISLKWVILALVVFFGNATSSILQRTQQTAFNGRHENMMMFFAMSIALIAFTCAYLKSDKTHTRVMVKETGWIPLLAGIANFLLNLFVIFLATSNLPPSLVYPVISVGGLAVSSLASSLLFKERLYPWQWAGMVLGALSVVFLSV